MHFIDIKTAVVFTGTDHDVCVLQFFSTEWNGFGNLSYSVSHKIVEIGNEVLEKNMEEWEIDEKAYEIEYPVRKIAHMTEYFILAVAVSLPFYVYGLRGFGLMLVAGLILRRLCRLGRVPSVLCGWERSVREGRGNRQHRSVLWNHGSAHLLLDDIGSCADDGAGAPPMGTEKREAESA